MSNLLKEAIADAKAVKAIAIENAKVALEETFNREVTGLFHNKIKEELETDELESSPAPVSKLSAQRQSEVPPDEIGGSDDTSISDAELDEILSSLEEELGQEQPPVQDPTQSAPVDPTAVPPAPVAPVDPAAPVAPVAQDVPQQVPSAPSAPVAQDVVQPPAPVDPAAPVAPVAQDDTVQEVDLDELLREISNDEDDTTCASDDDERESKEDEELKNENVKLRKELKEHVKVVEYLREQINEINLLNAKLLFTNKLFKQFGLSNSQKLNIVEKFDLTNTLREVKLTYTVLADQFNSGASGVKKTNTAAKAITEGLASKTVASTKPSKEAIVQDTNEMALRFQRLAGISK